MRQLSLFLIATLFISCSFQKNRTSQAEFETETVWTTETIARTLDWNLAQHESDEQHAALVMEGLTRVQETPSGFVVENVLAEKVENLSPTRWRIKLAERKWSDGTPLIAAHFVEAWKHHLAHLPKGIASPLDSVSGVTAFRTGLRPFERCSITSPDSRTIEIGLGQIESEFPSKLSHPQTWPRLPGPITALTPTLGPFRLLEWSPNSFARYQRNETHPAFAGQRHLLRIEAVSESSSRLDRFVSGESQLVEAAFESWPLFRESAALRTVKGSEMVGLLFVNETPPWNEATFRKALFAALDFEQLYRLLDQALLPETGFSSAGKSRESRDTKNLESLLKARGSVSLLLCADEDPLRERVAQIIAAQLNLLGSSLGLEARLAPLPLCDLRVVEGRGRGTDRSGLLNALLVRPKPKLPIPLAERLSKLADTAHADTAHTRLGDLEQWLTGEQGLYVTLGLRARGLLVAPRIGEIARSPLDFWDLRDTKL